MWHSCFVCSWSHELESLEQPSPALLLHASLSARRALVRRGRLICNTGLVADCAARAAGPAAAVLPPPPRRSVTAATTVAARLRCPCSPAVPYGCTPKQRRAVAGPGEQ